MLLVSWTNMSFFGCAALSMDSGGSEFCFSRESIGGPRIAAGRRRAHEFSREDAYARDTSFYAQMACEVAPATRLSGISITRGASGASPQLRGLAAAYQYLIRAEPNMGLGSAL